MWIEITVETDYGSLKREFAAIGMPVQQLDDLAPELAGMETVTSKTWVNLHQVAWVSLLGESFALLHFTDGIEMQTTVREEVQKISQWIASQSTA
jgi:hypothetical protein